MNGPTNKVLNSKKKSGVRYPTFEELSTDPISGNITSAYRPLRRSLYSLQLNNWLGYFPMKSIHVVDSALLAEQPASEMEKVERFLGLKRYLTAERFSWNAARGFYCMRKDPGDKKNRTSCRHPSKKRQKLSASKS